MKTHIVLDMTYTEEEGQQCFVGTEDQCWEFVNNQGSFGFEVKPLTQKEYKYHNEPQ